MSSFRPALTTREIQLQKDLKKKEEDEEEGEEEEEEEEVEELISQITKFDREHNMTTLRPVKLFIKPL